MNKIIKYMGNSPNSPITLRGLVDSKFARRIIGSKGNVHQFIQTTHEVKLYLHPEYDRYGRLCSVAGPVPNVAKAWTEIIEVIFRNAERIGRIWLKLLIPLELALKLEDASAKKGKGCILNEIANSTCTRITIRPTALPNTTEHLMEVSIDVNNNNNYLDNFTKALSMIGRQFQIHRHEALSPKNIYYIPFCYERAPIMDDDDEEEKEEEEEEDNRAHHQGKNDSDNGQRQQYQSHNKDKWIATFNHPPTASTSPPQPPQPPSPPSQQVVESPSSPSLLSPIISQTAFMIVSPTSIVSQFDHTTSINDRFTCQ